MSRKILFFIWTISLFFACEKRGEIEVLFQEAEKLEGDIVNSLSTISRCKSNYERVLIDAPESKFAPIACYKLGKLNEIFGHYDEAISFYRKLAAYYPEHPICAEGLLNAAQIYENQLNKTEDAISAYQQVITLYSDSKLTFQALFKQGMLWCRKEQWKKAIDNFQKIIAIYPKHNLCDDLLFRIADISQFQMEDYQRAAQSYQSLIESYPTSTWIKDARARLAELNQERKKK